MPLNKTVPFGVFPAVPRVEMLNNPDTIRFEKTSPLMILHRDTDHSPPSAVDQGPSTVDHLQADISAALAAALQPVLARLDALETGLMRRPPNVRPSTVQGGTVHGPPSQSDTSAGPPSTADPETWELRHLKHSERWTIYVPRAMREELKRRASARGQHPSLLVQEALQRYLTEEKRARKAPSIAHMGRGVGPPRGSARRAEGARISAI
jgi:hypothetical protein